MFLNLFLRSHPIAPREGDFPDVQSAGPTERDYF